jgi:signal peptidase I
MNLEVTPSETQVGSNRPESKRAVSRSCLPKQIAQCICFSILAFASFSIVTHFILESVTVVGYSMAPTLHNADHYLLNRWIYYFRAPKRQEIVVIRDPDTQGLAVKRVVAGAGDLVYFKGGCVYVNGRKIEERYLPPDTLTFPGNHSASQLFKCGEDAYFVLGDNRLNSADSRHYGPVVRSRILGMIVQ